MRCSKVQRYLEKQLDGELDERSGLKLLYHLDKCPACKAFLEKAKKLQLLLSALPQEEFPAWIHGQIMDKVHRLDNCRPGFFRRYKLAPVTAMLTIALSLWAGVKVGIVSYKIASPTKEETTTYTSIAYGEFGENTILDTITENGEEGE
ncbi:MAG TPA: zf-HC2 domain-containing protein [Candidatus Cloacimonas sp.]|jgi:predicted anti-sigma-YlaC factor YlaD|nr:anti-sigma factor [Candidatus Cloacimonas sp.]HNQ39279.1 zf-HC2 domain-containing protein [Candidatus Cloacimonas sp.]HNS84326.1 zf-HC2 domain-containing protein [Candidatus Cloacimonas sp.]HPA24407.1 zf-HC2 domain-containing protein [Candidatus Cloacimonas sp.]HPX09800.1 zf-HC2 domain-containing protein [Candidatus Cloacimonas sp.]